MRISHIRIFSECPARTNVRADGVKFIPPYFFFGEFSLERQIERESTGTGDDKRKEHNEKEYTRGAG